ncbi:1-acyl-sn-glycerol-3-phosphate acyltransferase [Novosphingobium sp.]|uniref:lysophospholipid acyltransferase family protein n=1 Tax=Novosphingobium sp. TaxID=1874826 RepID=UPI002733949A|nr:lysophospholipid acyltransferase family protein [Novosphingobium sp.]MDP3907258.1 lysophospholipid acyltransferase family protein [Novosphingobium sp.]
MPVALPRPRQVSVLGWLRISLRILGMAALLLVCVPLYYGWNLFTRHNPWPRAFLGGVTWLAGVRLRVEGEKVHRGAFLLANHVSWIDIPAIAGVTGSAFVAHDGLAMVPLLKWLCELNDTVFVARHDRKSVAAQVRAVRTALSENGALTVFPEGTTSDGTGLLPLKSSLLSALEPLPDGIAVQPVVLDYGPEAGGVAWVGDEPGLDNFLRILARRRPVDLTLRFLPVLAGEQLAGRKAMAAAAREAMLAALVR